eukprot:403344866
MTNKLKKYLQIYKITQNLNINHSSHQTLYLKLRVPQQAKADYLIQGNKEKLVQITFKNTEILLPEIGLSKYREESFNRSLYPINPFQCEKDTEKLLVVRERQREIQRIQALRKKINYTEMSKISKNNHSQNQTSISLHENNDITGQTLNSTTQFNNEKIYENTNNLNEQSGNKTVSYFHRRNYSQVPMMQNNEYSDREQIYLQTQYNKPQTGRPQISFNLRTVDVPSSQQVQSRNNKQVESISVFTDDQNQPKISHNKTHSQRFMQTITQNSDYSSSRNRGYLENKKDRTGMIRLIDEIEPSKDQFMKTFMKLNKRSKSEARNGGRQHVNKMLVFQEDQNKKYNVFNDQGLLHTQNSHNEQSSNSLEQHIQDIQKEVYQGQESIIDAAEQIQLDLVQFHQYQDQQEKQTIEFQAYQQKVLDEKKALDIKIQNLENEVSKVNLELRSVKEEVFPMKKQKQFVLDIAEEFIHSKIRKIISFQKAKFNNTQKANAFNTFLTQEKTNEESNLLPQNTKIEKDIIPFNKKQLLQFMHEMEEANLFLMKLIEDDEVQFSKGDPDFLSKQAMLKSQISDISATIQNFSTRREFSEKILKLNGIVVKRESTKKDRSALAQDLHIFNDVIQKIKQMHLSLFPDQDDLEHNQSQLSFQQILKQIQDKTEYLTEAFEYVQNQSNGNYQLQIQLQEKLKQLDQKRKMKKYNELQKIEREKQEKNYERNMERIRRGELVKKPEGKHIQSRSQKPKRKPKQEVPLLSKHEVDYEKYVNNV